MEVRNLSQGNSLTDETYLLAGKRQRETTHLFMSAKWLQLLLKSK